MRNRRKTKLDLCSTQFGITIYNVLLLPSPLYKVPFLLENEVVYQKAGIDVRHTELEQNKFVHKIV